MKGRAPKIAACTDGRDNNFDVLRLAAATLVLVAHSFDLTGRADPFSAHGDTLGALGVDMFFAISGFLICASFQADPSAFRYLAKRCLRIFPALWVAVLLTALVLGAVVTTLPVGSYLTAAATWRYIVGHAALHTGGGTLPGVFHTLPYPDAVNGSLWTLPYEFAAYLGVLVLGTTRLLGRWILGAACVWWVWELHHTALTGLVHVRVFAFFTFGAALWLWRRRVRLSWVVGIALGAAWVLSWGSATMQMWTLLFIPYAMLTLAYRTPRALRRLTALGDVSYGMYVYAFPLTQLFVWAEHPRSVAVLALEVFAASWVLGLISWRAIERPALRLKRHLRTRPARGWVWSRRIRNQRDAQRATMGPSDGAEHGNEAFGDGSAVQP